MKEHPGHNASDLLHHYREIQSAGKIGHWIWDIQSGDLVWSDEIYTIFDIDPSNFSQSYEGFIQKVHPEDRSSVENAVNNALYNHDTYDIKHRIMLSGNGIRTVHEHATVLFDDEDKPFQMLGTVQDITELSQLNSQLESYKEHLHHLQQHSPVLLISGKITELIEIDYCSPNLPKMFGYAPHSLCYHQHRFSDIVHPKDQNRLAALVNEFQHTQKADAFLRLQHKNGGYLYCHITLHSGDKHPNSFVGYIENLNDSFIARNEADLLKSLINDLTDAIFIFDPATGDILDTNKQACEILGYRQRELTYMNIRDINTNIATPAAWQEYVTAMRQKQRMLLECEYLCKDGTHLPIEVNATYIETDRAYIAAVARDITKRRAIEMELSAYRQRLEEMIEQRTQELKSVNTQLNAYIGIVDKNILTSSTDTKGKITEVSDAFCKKTGYSREELIGKSHRILKHPDTPDTHYEKLWKKITSGKVWQHELKMRTKNGDDFWMDVTIEPLFDEESKITGYTAIRHDITYQKQVEQLAITDPLTGLYNRRHFYELFPRELRRAKRHNLCINFLMIDIDFFKQYNDTYGHKKGDRVLENVGTLLKNSLKRADDYAFRLGGEEFGIIFITDNFKQAEFFCENLLFEARKLGIPHRSSLISKELTLSIGMVSSYIQTIPEWETIYDMADKALYHVKESGRNNMFVTTFI